MPRLSKPIDQLRAHYEVLVVGSGYGGAISASRMARAGRSVGLLERGLEIRPGEYPENGLEAASQVQATLPVGQKNAHIGKRTGLYDMHIDDEINVLVGCGLGGTSLINANVSIRPDPRVFQAPQWPEGLRRDGELLDRCFARATQMLRPNPVPDTAEHLPKLAAHKASADAMGIPWAKANINVTFEDGVNHVGVMQKACTLCGDCVTGCNHSAKNTVLMNYLPDASNHGAELFCGCSVQHLERRGDRWIVHFELLDAGREKFDAPAMFVTADIVILAAGTLGTAGILMRSREQGLTLSDQLGQHFTGNGDVLGFAMNTLEPMNGLGWGDRDGKKVGAVGPCITSLIDNRGTDTLEDGWIIQEGNMPGPIEKFVEEVLPHTRNVASGDGFAGAVSNFVADVKTHFSDGISGSLKHTQTYLVMAHDDGKGQLRLVDGEVRVDWPGVGSQGIIEQVNESLGQAATALGGAFTPNPIWTKLFKKALVTVHPLGGSHMGEDATLGVTDHKGRVYSGSTGTAIHEGLYVSDGGLISRPIGVNPLLTISALAERNCVYLAQDRGWTIDYSLPSAPKGAAAEQPVGVRFTETMKGHLSTTVLDDYKAAAADGKAKDSPFQFILTISSRDVDVLVDDPKHPAELAGSVTAPALSPDPLRVTNGHFNLFLQDEDDPALKRMWYRMQLHAVDGSAYYFEGFKLVKHDAPLDGWADTTTLYVTVWKGSDSSGEVVGKGVLRIKPADFAKQLTTMKAIGAKTLAEKTRALGRFGQAFAGELWATYVSG